MSRNEEIQKYEIHKQRMKYSSNKLEMKTNSNRSGNSCKTQKGRIVLLNLTTSAYENITKDGIRKLERK